MSRNIWLEPLYTGLVWRLELQNVSDIFDADILWTWNHSGDKGRDITVATGCMFKTKTTDGREIIETTVNRNQLRLQQALEDHKRWTAGAVRRGSGKVEVVWHYFTDVILCISQQQWKNELIANGGARVNFLIQNLASKHRKSFPNSTRYPRYSMRPDPSIKDDSVVFFFGKGVYLPQHKDEPICNVLPALNGVLNSTVMIKVWKLPTPKPKVQATWWKTPATEVSEDEQNDGKELDKPAMFYDTQECFMCTPERQGPLPIPGWYAPDGAFLLVRKDGRDNWTATCDDGGDIEICPPAALDKKWVFRRIPKPNNPIPLPHPLDRIGEGKDLPVKEGSMAEEVKTQATAVISEGAQVQLVAESATNTTPELQPPVDIQAIPPQATLSDAEANPNLQLNQLLALELTPKETVLDTPKNKSEVGIIGRTIMRIRKAILPTPSQPQADASIYTLKLEAINIPNLAEGIDQLTIYLDDNGSLITSSQIKCALHDSVGLNRFISLLHNATVSASLSIRGRQIRQWLGPVKEPYDIGTTGAKLLPPIKPGRAGLIQFSTKSAYAYPLNNVPGTLGRTDPGDPHNPPDIALDQLVQPCSIFGGGQMIHDISLANLCLSRYHASVWVEGNKLIAEPIKDDMGNYKNVTLLHLDEHNNVKPTANKRLILEPGDGLLAGYALLRFSEQK